jgi:GT2 family glycosyltransferase
MPPVVSVVVTSDYAINNPSSKDEFRKCVAALSRQDVEEPVEFLVVESSDLAPDFAAELRRILPALRIVTANESSAAALKNTGARLASADLVAFIDADCIAAPGWLRCFLAAMREHPDAAVVSGRTDYGSRSFLHRAMGLLSRAYLDQDHAGYTRHVSVNNAGFRRSVFLACPFPDEGGAHMSLLQAEALRRGGHRFFFEPKLSVRHAYEGWAAERQIRRSLGYGVIKTRLIDRRVPYASLARLGYLSIPIFALLRALHGCWHCVRRRRAYGVAWHELPAAFMLAAVVALMEIPGMVRAVRGKPLDKTLFR